MYLDSRNFVTTVVLQVDELQFVTQLQVGNLHLRGLPEAGWKKSIFSGAHKEKTSRFSNKISILISLTL